MKLTMSALKYSKIGLAAIIIINNK